MIHLVHMAKNHDIVTRVIPGVGNVPPAVSVMVMGKPSKKGPAKAISYVLWGQLGGKLGEELARVRAWEAGARPGPAGEAVSVEEDRLLFHCDGIEWVEFEVAKTLGLPEYLTYVTLRTSGTPGNPAFRISVDYPPSHTGEVLSPSWHGSLLDFGGGIIRKVPPALAAFEGERAYLNSTAPTPARAMRYEAEARRLLGTQEAWDRLVQSKSLRVVLATEMSERPDDDGTGSLNRRPVLFEDRSMGNVLLRREQDAAFLAVLDDVGVAAMPASFYAHDVALIVSEPLRVRLSLLNEFRCLPSGRRHELIFSKGAEGEEFDPRIPRFAGHVYGYGAWSGRRPSGFRFGQAYYGDDSREEHPAAGVVVSYGDATVTLSGTDPTACRVAEAIRAGATTFELDGVSMGMAEVIDVLVRPAVSSLVPVVPSVPPPDASIPEEDEDALVPQDGLEGDDLVPASVTARERPERTPGNAGLLAHTNVEVVNRRSVPVPRRSHGDIAEVERYLASGEELKPHQRGGLGVMADAYALGLPGIIVADEPGLGKTMTLLCFMLWLIAQGRGPILVVVPHNHVDNWTRDGLELFNRSPLGRPVEAFGHLFTRAGGADRNHRFAEIRQRPWTVTTYDVLKRNQAAFGTIPFSCVVYDEAQAMKNFWTHVRAAGWALQSDFTVPVSGTPIENGWWEIWSLADLAWPGRLESLRDFDRLVSGGEPDDVAKALSDDLLIDEATGFAEGKAYPMVLHRTKDQALDLPDKLVRTTDVMMEGDQRDLYMRILVEGRLSPGLRQEDRSGRDLLATLAKLRQVTLHPDPVGMLPEDLTAAVVDRYVRRSATLTHIWGLLDGVRRRGEKAILPIHFLERQQEVARAFGFMLGVGGLPFVNGRHGREERRGILRAWEGVEGFAALLITPRTGGVGWNLTQANNNFPMSRWYNPALDLQVEDRCHRIGQTRVVNVEYTRALHPELLDRENMDFNWDVLVDGIQSSKRRMVAGFFQPHELGGRAALDRDIGKRFRLA